MSGTTFILHRLAFQASIWQQIFDSQGWASTILPGNTKLLPQLINLESNNKPWPDLLIVDDSIRDPNIEELCSWLESRNAQLPVIAVTASNTGKISPTAQQLAKSQGAFDLLPDFEESVLAIAAVNAMKSAAAALGNPSTDNNALVTCIVNISKDFATQSNDIKAKPESDNNKEPLSEDIPSNQKVEATPKKKKRLYRGREY